jgi:hypothetical protein
MHDAFGYRLINGRTTSCGCISVRALRHGLTGSRTYNAWASAKQRCTNPHHVAWNDYGGRGIRICDRWRDSFDAFLADMGEAPSAYHSIDRLDANGHYEPGNCRWATPLQQANNKRTTHRLTFRGDTRTITEWGRHLDIPPGRIKARLHLGWTVERALTTP